VTPLAPAKPFRASLPVGPVEFSEMVIRAALQRALPYAFHQQGTPGNEMEQREQACQIARLPGHPFDSEGDMTDSEDFSSFSPRARSLSPSSPRPARQVDYMSDMGDYETDSDDDWQFS